MAHPKGGYRNKAGEKVPSVTGITGRFKESGGLIWWAFRQGQANPTARTPYEATEKAANIGTLAHSMVELHIRGENPKDSMDFVLAEEDSRNKALQAFEAYLRWKRQSTIEIIDQEMQLVSEEFQFGGTPDAIGRFDGGLTLLDWKTSNKTYVDHMIQIAGYGILIEEHYGEITEGYHLLRFAKDGPDFHHHQWMDLSDARDQFLRLREAFAADKNLKRRI